MRFHHSVPKLCIASAVSILFVSACSVAKIESRIEANPQCKDVINPKTGAVMPCPGTDKAFYRSVGLEPARVVVPVAAVNAASQASASEPSTSPTSLSNSSINAAKPITTVVSPQADCKPQIHKKTGGMLPCPPVD
jgi:hypothetical protein